MNRSESIAALAEAFVAFQAEVKNPTKNTTATIRKKAGGEYSYTYVTLADVLDLVRPALTKHGLAVAQELVADKDGEVGCATLLMHKSGEWIAFSPLFVPGGADAKEHGGAASYARRYSLMAALNLAAADDDDESSPPPRRSAPRKAAATAAPVMITERQKSKIAAEAEACGITDAQLAKSLVRDFKVETTGELTRDQASELIARLMKRHEELEEEDGPVPGRRTLKDAVDADYEEARVDLGI